MQDVATLLAHDLGVVAGERIGKEPTRCKLAMVGEEEGRIGAIGIDAGAWAAHAAQRGGGH